MRKLVILAILLVIGVEIYQALRPVETVVEAHVVRADDTMYGICDRYYITENNAECFNEMWYRVMRENGKISLNVGNIVWVTNKLYK